MKTCRHCRAANSLDSTYCYLCTRLLDRQMEQAATRWEAIRSCDFCGAPNLEVATVCYRCGDPLHKPADDFSAAGDPQDWRAQLRAMRDQQPRPPAASPTKEKTSVQPGWKVKPKPV